jgi:hypothetical protein
VTLLLFSLAQRFVWMPLLYAQVVFLFLFLRGLSLGVCETYTSTCVQQWFVQKRGRAVSLLNIFFVAWKCCFGASDLRHGAWPWLAFYSGLRVACKFSLDPPSDISTAAES